LHLPRLHLTTALLWLATACVAAPSQPSAPPELQIHGTTLLMPGARGRLTAWRPGDGQLREVAARWSLDGTAVSLTSGGEVTAERLGQATVRASYQDLVGTTTVHVVASVAGTWRGSILVVDCWPAVEGTTKGCEGQRGLTAPLVLNVSQRAAADNDNLSAVVDVFTPPAHGSFVGAVDSSGLFFLDGFVQRPDGSLSGAARFRWTLENNQLVPFKVNGQVEDRIDVQLSVRTGSSSALVNEIWQLGSMIR
jgi:hypothetical protein